MKEDHDYPNTCFLALFSVYVFRSNALQQRLSDAYGLNVCYWELGDDPQPRCGITALNFV